MATDGVKIIDGDLAHDTYWGIMDLYDSNIDITQIKENFPFARREYGTDSDFYHEIFVTAYALAFWEIGGLTTEMLAEVNAVIQVGAGVKVWTEEINDKAGKARQKELDKLVKKISEPNLKIRSRKKYRKITHFIFQADDLLTFQLKNGYYLAVVCASIHQYRGACTYMLTPTTYMSKTKPTVEDIINYDISGILIGSGFDRETTITMQPGVETLWPLYAYYGVCFFGLVQIGVDHKDLINFKDKFEKVGTLKIRDAFKQHGSRSGFNDFDKFLMLFDDFAKEQKYYDSKKFPVRLMCEL